MHPHRTRKCEQRILHRRYIILGTSVKEKDLGVSADMTVSEQRGLAAAKGNQILGLIRRNITYMEKKLIIPL